MPYAIVVGASIAGLAAAIALLRRGFAVTVVEHAERGAAGGAGLALTHAALLQLHSLGVSVPTAAIEEQCVLLGDEVLRRRAICSHAVRWSELRDALLRAAEACGATVQHGVRATGYTPTPDGAVQFGGKRFDVLIGADGIRSAVRAELHRRLDAPPPSPAQLGRSTWRGTCVLDDEASSALRRRFPLLGRCLYSALPAEARDRGSWGHHGVFYQLPDGSINWLLYCEHGAAAATDLDAARALAARSYAASIGVLMAATPAPTCHDVHDLRSGYWRHGAVVLVGDAAHACSPHLAMGANLALADAEALGECLAAVGSGGQAVPAALGRFEEARRPPADAACLLSRRIGSVRQGCHGPIPSAEALTEMSGDASTAHRSRI